MKNLNAISRRKEKGFSLIQVVIMTTVMSAAGATLTASITSQMNSLSFLEDKLRREKVETDLISLVENNCSFNMIGRRVNLTRGSSQTINRFVDASGATVSS